MVRFFVALALTVGAVLASGSACTLLDDDPPDDVCRDDGDCFRAQGEVCNPNTKRCEQRTFLDAGIDAP